MVEKGFFITFEGGEGAGKSTQIARLERKLREKRYDVVVTREPGGSPGAEAVRAVILSGAVEPLGTTMEAILFAAARADHIEQVIRPALERGDWVVCDRFADSTRVYQGVLGHVDSRLIKRLEKITVGETGPDLTIVLDADPADAVATIESKDRLEAAGDELHRRARQHFLDLAAADPGRYLVLYARRAREDIAAEIRARLMPLLEGPLG